MQSNVPFESIAQMEKFLTSVVGLPNSGSYWFYAGGYAYYMWCKHYELPEVETKDFDIYVDPAYVDKVREKIKPGAVVEGKLVTIHSAPLGAGYVVINGCHLENPEVLARVYGSGEDEGLLKGIKSIKKPSTEGEAQVKETGEEAQDEGKADRRKRRREGMPALLTKFKTDVKTGKLVLFY